MRPLPDLTDLAQQPTVFDQSADSFTTTFASEFSSADAQQSVADASSPAIFASMDPISGAIDALGSAMDLAGSVFDLLSGDLDLVNLDPQILNFEGYDSSIYGGIDSFTPDFGASANIILDGLSSLMGSLIGNALYWIDNIAIQAANDASEALSLADYVFNRFIQAG